MEPPAQHDERTPLLRADTNKSQESSTQEQIKHDRLRVWIMLACLTMLLFTASSDQLMESPITRTMEAISCYRYYEVVDPSKLLTNPNDAGPGAIHGVDEVWCKADAIQAEVAMVRSWQVFFESIPALFLAVPFGWLQDKYGRRPFIIAGMAAFLFKGFWIAMVLYFWQTFELRWTWFSALHALCMGGSPVVSALFYTIITDVTKETDRAVVFLRIGALNLSTFFFIPPLTAWFMSYNTWAPIFAGLGLAIISVLITFFIPETMGFQQKLQGDPTPAEAVPGPPDLAADLQPISASFAQRLYSGFQEATSFMWEDLRLPILVLPYLCHILIISATQLLVQYSSKRYELSIAQSTLLVTIRAGVNVIVLFSIIPFISTILVERFGFTTKYKELRVTQASLLLTGIGWIMVGLSPTIWSLVVSLVVASLGIGAMTTLRSFILALVPDEYIARIFSVICVVDTVGVMFGAPLLAECFKIGMKAGGAAIGLPFFVLGGAAVVLTILVLGVRIYKGEDETVNLDQDSS